MIPHEPEPDNTGEGKPTDLDLFIKLHLCPSYSCPCHNRKIWDYYIMRAIKKYTSTFLFITLLTTTAWSQTISGTVRDAETKDILPDASIVQKGTVNGTSAGADGSFKLTLLEGKSQVLIVTYVGYSPEVYTVKQFNSPLRLELSPIVFQGREVFIEATRAGKTTPVTQTTIARAKIEQDNIGQDPVFTLAKLTPSILTHSDSGTRFSNYSYLRLRGMDQTRINITLNGVPLNDMIDQGVFFSNFNDFGNSIQSVQVQRGVGTSTSGTASYAGSINFESQDLSTGEASVSAKATGGSFNSHRVSGTVKTGSLNNFAFFSRFSNIGSDGYRFHSGTESNTFFASGAYFGDKDILRFTAFIGRTQNELAYTPVPIDVIKEEPRTNTVSENDEDNFGQQFFQFQHNRTLNNRFSINSSIYYGGAGGDFPVGLNDANGEFVQQVFSLQNDHYGLKSAVEFNSGDRLGISGGIHTYRFNRINEEWFAPESEVVTYADDSRKDEFSAFAKAAYRIGDVEFYGDIQIRSVWLQLNPDIPFLVDAGVSRGEASVPTRSWMFINPKAGLTYHLNNNLNIYGSFGRSGREPTRQDILGATNINASNLPIVQNEDAVKAEYVDDYEGGVRFQKGWLSGKLNGFFMQFQNEISPTGAFIPEGFVQLRENISRSYRTGIEVEWDWKILKSLSIYGNTTWMQTNINAFSPGNSDEVFEDVESILSPNWLGNATVSYKAFDWMDVSFSGRYVGEAFLELTNNPEFIKPSFFTASMGFDMRLSSAVSASLKVNNLFDKLYFTNGAPLDTNFDERFDTRGFIVQPPRHVFAEIKVDI